MTATRMQRIAELAARRAVKAASASATTTPAAA